MDNKAVLRQKWQEADEHPGTVVDIGDIVVCDICDEDFTDSQEQGGFIFGSNAYCPRCAKRSLPDIKKYGEESYIRATCPDGKPFADFVRKYRGKGTIEMWEIHP